MCFFIHKKHREPKVATDDITCWKVISRSGLSIHKAFLYEKDKTYTSDIVLVDNMIEDGLHSYSDAYNVAKSCGWDGFGFPGRVIVLIAMKLFGRARIDCNKVVIKFKIPKGSTYYYNPDYHEYVSDKIVRLK